MNKHSYGVSCDCERCGKERNRRSMQAARDPRNKPKRRRRVKPDAWHNDTGPAFFKDPDGMDRDDLGVSNDF